LVGSPKGSTDSTIVILYNGSHNCTNVVCLSWKYDQEDEGHKAIAKDMTTDTWDISIIDQYDGIVGKFESTIFIF